MTDTDNQGSAVLAQGATLSARHLMVPLDKYPVVAADDTLATAAAALSDWHIEMDGSLSMPRILLVLTEAGELAGIVRRRDILRGLAPSFLVSAISDHPEKMFDVEVDPNLTELLSDRAAEKLRAKLGRMKREEILGLAITLAAVVAMSLRSFVPALAFLEKSAIIAAASVLFFVFRVLRREDLEALPWNIVLLFGGAISMGFCLWQTGAAEWLAISWLTYLQGHGPLVFILGIAVFVMLMTNVIMNVAAIAISLPVALVMAPYLGVAPEVVLFVALTAAGMPFLFLVGAAPNAIAYQSRQFTTGEFFMAGVPVSLLVLLVTAVFVVFVWPLMGMPIYSGQ